MKKIIILIGFLILVQFTLVSALTIQELVSDIKSNSSNYTIITGNLADSLEIQAAQTLGAYLGVTRYSTDLNYTAYDENLIVIGNPTSNSITKAFVDEESLSVDTTLIETDNLLGNKLLISSLSPDELTLSIPSFLNLINLGDSRLNSRSILMQESSIVDSFELSCINTIKNSYLKRDFITLSGLNFTDECLTDSLSNTLIEYSCTNNNLVINTHTCANKCEEGRCLSLIDSDNSQEISLKELVHYSYNWLISSSPESEDLREAILDWRSS